MGSFGGSEMINNAVYDDSKPISKKSSVKKFEVFKQEVNKIQENQDIIRRLDTIFGKKLGLVKNPRKALKFLKDKLKSGDFEKRENFL